MKKQTSYQKLKAKLVEANRQLHVLARLPMSPEGISIRQSIKLKDEINDIAMFGDHSNRGNGIFEQIN